MKKIILLALLITLPILGQQNIEKRLRQYVNSNEIVTLAEHIPFDKAIEVLSKVSKLNTGKSIMLSGVYTEPIGIEITKMPYLRALNIIVNYHDMVYKEDADVILVMPEKSANSQKKKDVKTYAAVNSREVKISALFFEANISDIKERGINWDLMLEKAGLNFGAKIVSFTDELEEGGGASQGVTHEFIASDNKTKFDMGDFSGNITGAFKFFETNGLGELIARPNIIVRDGSKGRIQIGSDISIKERDFSGNLIDRFYSTGTIVEVTPFIYNEDGLDYVLLQLSAERSSADPGEVTTEIRKTVATTEVLMLNGEETIIGGLFTHEEIITRSGIPFLKDLPWWVFGIRYLVGADKTTIVKKEIIILIRLEIIPPLKERIAQKKKELLKRVMLDNNEYIKGIIKQKTEAHIELDDVEINEE